MHLNVANKYCFIGDKREKVRSGGQKKWYEEGEWSFNLFSLK